MDIRTLIITLLAQVTLLGALAIYLESHQPGTRAMRVWGMGLLAMGGGFVALALRGAAPDLLSILLGNLLLMGANLLFYRSLRVFDGKPVGDPFGIAALVLTAAAMYAFSEIWPSIGLRVIFYSVISAAMFARNALTLRGHAPPEVRASRRFMEAVFWTMTGVMTLRALTALDYPGADLMAPSVTQAVFFLLMLLGTTAGCFGMFWMEIQHLHIELARQASRDSLTGMLNRRSLFAVLERELARARRGGAVLSVGMFDLDRFKGLNDTYGHPAGDEVLRSVAATMQASIRQPDVLGRYGGEEFVLVMPDTDANMAMHVAERIRAAVQEKAIPWDDRLLSITISGGVAAFPGDGTTADALVSAADVALYEAKRAGRNRVLRSGTSAGMAGSASGTHATS